MSVIWWVINIHILSLVDGFGSNLFYMIEYTLTTKPWQHLPNQLATRPLHCDQRLYLVVYRSTGKHQCLFLNHHSDPWSNVHDLWQNLWSYQTGLFDWKEFWLILKSRKTFWGEKKHYIYAFLLQHCEIHPKIKPTIIHIFEVACYGFNYFHSEALVLVFSLTTHVSTGCLYLRKYGMGHKHHHNPHNTCISLTGKHVKCNNNISKI